MRRIILLVILSAAILAIAVTFAPADEAAKIIPVKTWPRVIYLPSKMVVNPSPAICISAGYRLLKPAEKIPAGKVVATSKIIQDPNDPAKAIYSRTYADKPTPPPPEPVTNVSADKVRFQFTASGAWMGATWIDAPKTNGVK